MSGSAVEAERKKMRRKAMFCTKCGAQMPDGTAFCTSCGNRLEAGREPAGAAGAPGVTEGAAPRAAPDGRPRRTALVVAGIVAAIVVVAVLAWFLLAGGGQGASRQELPSSGSSSAASAASSSSSGSSREEAPDVIEVDGVRVAPLDGFASKGLSWTGGDEGIDLVDGDGRVLAAVLWGDRMSKQGEAKCEVYHLMADSTELAVLNVYYFDSLGDHIYAGDTSTTGTRVIEDFGFTGDDLVGCVSFYRNGDYVAAKLLSHLSGTDPYVGSQPESTSARAGAEAPFWGVWIGASKDESGARSMASEAQGKGLPAEVFYTTDWSNLNPEPWYVVSVGTSSSESEADVLRDQAVSAGYSDAYVKYSGDHA